MLEKYKFNFLSFCRREEKQYVEGMEDEEPWRAGRREMQNLAYPPAFKLEVALYARKHSQYAAAKIFGVARRRIFDWMRQIPKLEELIAKGHMKKMTGRGPRDRDIDRALYRWYLERRDAGERPKSAAVQAKAREVYAAHGYKDMKCSYGWFKRWSQRFQVFNEKRINKLKRGLDIRLLPFFNKVFYKLLFFN